MMDRGRRCWLALLFRKAELSANRRNIGIERVNGSLKGCITLEINRTCSWLLRPRLRTRPQTVVLLPQRYEALQHRLDSFQSCLPCCPSLSFVIIHRSRDPRCMRV